MSWRTAWVWPWTKKQKPSSRIFAGLERMKARTNPKFRQRPLGRFMLRQITGSATEILNYPSKGVK